MAEHENRELRSVNPMSVCVSEYNERKNVIIDPEFKESIKDNGVQEPPLVREAPADRKEQGYEYAVIAGQRRTNAAQSVGLNSMQVVYWKDCSDSEALEASIIENMDEFRENVSRKDRAQAVYDLKKMNEWTQGEVADHLNVARSTIRTWLEFMNDEWEDTVIHATEKSSSIDVDDISQEIFRIVRSETGGGDDGELAINVIQREGLTNGDVREASRLSELDNPHSFLDHLEIVGQERKEVSNMPQERKTRVKITFSSETANNLRDAAAERECTVKQFVRGVVKDEVN